MRSLHLLLLGLIGLTGCQGGLLIEEADLARLDRCLLAHEMQYDLLVTHQLRLEEIHAELEQGRSVDDRLETLSLQLAGLEATLAANGERECPEPPAAAGAEAAGRAGSRIDDKLIVGGVENVRFDDESLTLRARIDTGAATSSLDARDIRSFERDGERWVRFSVVGADGSPLVLERPRSRRVRILQAGAEEAERRPVVELRVSIGGLTQTAEFTLSDRAHLEFPVLIGRNMLRDLMVVDVSKRDAAPLEDNGDGDGS